MTIEAVLVDARNWAEMKPRLVELVSQAPFTGFDIETFDEPHEGLKAIRTKKKIVFDVNRTTVAGLSLYPDKHNTAYYLNLHHADTENRLPWSEVREVLDARNPGGHWLCHNAPFELTMMSKSLGYELKDVVCTLQMAVSAYGPDEYDKERFVEHFPGDMTKLFKTAARAFHNYERGQNMTADQAEVFAQAIGKASSASHSYNGVVDKITYGYGLKQAVESHFGFKMRTFEETLGDKAHMGELTGEEVVAYGADDAYWCVRLFHHLLLYMSRTNPKVIKTFFEQENPMIYIYADIWKTGLNVNSEQIEARRADERAAAADTLRGLKKAVRNLLPFSDEPHAGLMENESWYRKNGASYRNRIEAWAKKPDSSDDFEQCLQAAGAVSNAWSAEHGKAKPSGPNFTHYMVMRVLMYDLLRQRVIKYKGKVQSDGESRGRLIKRLKKEDNLVGQQMIGAINELAGIEQRMKLYLTPYTRLKDPDTGRMYPVVTSKLATRRLACSDPNAMQLGKRDESSTYIRGFFLPDEDDHVLVSLDWSQIELVLIGEQSGDPEFAKAYAQLPYEDLHLGAAADTLGYDEDLIKHLDSMDEKDIPEPLLINVDGDRMSPRNAKKYWRTVAGKGSNFNYWYSGALSTVGEVLGWTPDQMWEATNRYRERFAIAEKWRREQIDMGRANGYVELPDGHRRVRFEATPLWAQIVRHQFGASNVQGIARFGEEVIRATQSRAGNQLVNGVIQGTCATLAKRSTLRIVREIKETGMDARFKMPIHDELLWSVHRREVNDFIPMAKRIMTDHPDIISKLTMDCTASVGLTFEPWRADKAPYGQIELDEAPALDFLPPETRDGKLNAEQTEAVIEWLFKQKEAA